MLFSLPNIHASSLSKNKMLAQSRSRYDTLGMFSKQLSSGRYAKVNIYALTCGESRCLLSGVRSKVIICLISLAQPFRAELLITAKSVYLLFPPLGSQVLSCFASCEMRYSSPRYRCALEVGTSLTHNPNNRFVMTSIVMPHVSCSSLLTKQ